MEIRSIFKVNPKRKYLQIFTDIFLSILFFDYLPAILKSAFGKSKSMLVSESRSYIIDFL